MDKRRKRKPFKVDLTLKPEDRAAYDAYLSDKRTTLEMAFAWLNERGYALSWGAVFRHRQRFLDNLQDVQTWAQVALQFSEAARVSGRDVLAEATLTKFEQLFMQMLFEMNKAESQKQAMTTKEWGELAGAIGKVVTTRERMAEFRQRYEERAKQAVEEAKKAAKQGDSGTAVADRVREMLGIPLWDGDEDWKYGVPEYEMETFQDPLTLERKDIDGRVLSPDEYDENPPHRLKHRKPMFPPPKGLLPLDPPLPHPRAKKQFAATPPVDRPIAQAIWEAKEKKKAEQGGEGGQGGQKQLPAPQGEAAPGPGAAPSPLLQPRPSGSAPRRVPG